MRFLFKNHLLRNYLNLIAFAIFLYRPLISAKDTITVVNKTNETAFVAIYNTKGERISSVPTPVPPISRLGHTGELGTNLIDYSGQSIFGTNASLLLAQRSEDQLKPQMPLVGYQGTFLAGGLLEEATKRVLLDTLGTEMGATAAERSDTITVSNKTTEVVAAALYYDDGTTAYRWGNSFTLLEDESKEVTRPERKCTKTMFKGCIEFYDRKLYYTRSGVDLPLQLNKKKDKLPKHINVGSAYGSSFVIYEDDAQKLQGSTLVEWQARAALNSAQALLQPQYEKIKERFQALDYLGKNQVAAVRKGTALSVQEVAYRAKRREKYVLPACMKLWKARKGAAAQPLGTVPTMSLCVSGGGIRAMLIAAGFMAAAEEAGLLPFVSYVATLSGSTWYQAGWLTSGLSAAEYYKQITGQLTKGIMKGFNIDHLIEAVTIAKTFGRLPTIVDVYGALLADKLLKPYSKNPNALLFGAPDPRVDAAEVPYPIYTAVTPKQFSDLDLSKNLAAYYHWVIFDPYEVSIFDVENVALNASVPSWSFGRTFKQGVSVSMEPPLLLSLCMGSWGSAMSVNPRDVVGLVAGSASPETSDKIMGIIAKNSYLSLLVQQRVSPAKIPNFVAEGKMTLVDGGMSLILPFPPLLKKERSVDIIIAIDAGAAISKAPGPRGVQDYVTKNKIPFPKMDVRGVLSSEQPLGQNPYTILWDKKLKGAPAVAYIPMIAHANYYNGWEPEGELTTNTFNFTYTKEEAEKLSGLGKVMFKDAEPQLMDMIFEWLEMHNGG